MLKWETYAGLVQVVTILALILGVFLVVWELRQTREAARAQVSSDSFAMSAATREAMLGESAAEVLAKACTSPESMTDAEVIVLSMYYTNQVQQLYRMIVIDDRSGLYDGLWRDYAGNMLGGVFATAPGRAWWETRWQRYGELGELGNAMLAELGAPSCRAQMQAHHARVSELVEEFGL